MKKKIPFPVSIDEELANWIAKEIENSEFRNKSHLVEEAIKEFKKKREDKPNLGKAKMGPSHGGEIGHE